ncbi:hypothetical protein B0H34DRAFT_734649 [Crassisporium funariophilum]|nr:hypothetical protein B0H34DRAFT_734649 [Crassisporium funariophilum]
MASVQALPEPMNSSPHHSKVKITTTFADPTFVAGTYVSGKLDMECRADRGLGIGIMMVELFAIQELTSRDHSATSTFLHSRRLFQGPGLPPSNAVQAHPMPGDPPLPQHYYQARRGRSTFLFRIPIPASSPSSISFGSGLAKVRYELRSSVGVYWKSEKRLVVDKHGVDVVEAYPFEDTYMSKSPEAIVVGENGKLWMQGRMVGHVVVAGESACLELQVKNHSNKKNSGLTLTLTRTLYLPGSSTGQQRPAPVQISDVLTTVPFRGSEYIIPPGAEGVANLVFDVPKNARGVQGGTLDGEESEGGIGPRHTESLFEIKCKVEVKLIMGMGSKDILLEIPINIVHPNAIPQQPIPGPYAQPAAYTYNAAALEPVSNPVPYADYNPYYPMPPLSPAPLNLPYMDPTHGQVWLPPPPPLIPLSQTPQGHHYMPMSPIPHDVYQQQPYPVQPYYPPPIQSPQENLVVPVGGYIPRPSSAGAVVSASQMPQSIVSGLPALTTTTLLPLHDLNHHMVRDHTGDAAANYNYAVPITAPTSYEPEAGKGERASRITQHMRMLSRNRSVSPQSHRYPLPPGMSTAGPVSIGQTSPTAATGTQPQAMPKRRNLPPPPGMLLTDNLSLSPPTDGVGGVVHSPRPQLTPKHSFTRDPVLGAVAKSERVEELEKMADEVGRKSHDLSADLPKVSEGTSSATAVSVEKMKAEVETGGDEDMNLNKTLPGPPVPSGKMKDLLASGASGRPRADLYFSSDVQQDPGQITPESSYKTPPTPTLMAVLAPKHPRLDKPDAMLRSESGLDALERRLLAEVGTRNFDPRRVPKDQRPDVRSLLPSSSLSPIDTDMSMGRSPNADRGMSRSTAIAIPIKSPEPLNDSAISSLTLAGGLGGDDSDGEFDGKTHRAGRSRSASGDENDREHATTGLHMHMRARAEVGTPTKTLAREREKAREVEAKEKAKEGKSSGKKKERTSGEKSRNKSAAKGRVAAWLGRIHPDEPPEEEIIPPSPSVVCDPSLEASGEDVDEPLAPPSGNAHEHVPEPPRTPTAEYEKAVSASPNPRSSGFVPIATLKRDTIHPRHLLARDATVVEEARRVQDIWSNPATDAAVLQEKPAHKHPLTMAPSAAFQSIRTDRRVSPPSSKPLPPNANINADPKTKVPMSYSAAARNVWRLPAVPVTTVKAQAAPTTPQPLMKPPSLPPKPSHLSGGGRLPVFPPPRPLDPEVKYDIRSARGGRGGKVSSVASMWASGAINNSDHNGKAKDIPKRLSAVVETSAAPTKPPTDKKSFSAVVMTPPKPGPVGSGSTGGSGGSKQKEAQRRPDARAVFAATAHRGTDSPSSKKVTSSTPFFLPVARPTVSAGTASKSTDNLAQRRRPAPSGPYISNGKLTPTSHSTPNSSDPRLHEFAAKGVKPAIVKGNHDPAVVSSSHATPTLSSTASLARPHTHITEARKHVPSRPIKLPTASAPTSSSGAPSAVLVSPSKPAELAFGQARLRDLIKKYQGPGSGQKT